MDSLKTLAMSSACVTILVCGAISSAHSQTLNSTSLSGIQPASGPGVDVWQTLYPRAPQSNPPSATIPQQTYQNLSQPVGYNQGAFTFYPSVTGATFYDDNVFALHSNRRGDQAFVAKPEIDFKSNGWENGELYGGAAIEGRKYAQFSSEDQLNAVAALGGTYNISPNAQFVGRFQYTRGHEDRGTSDDIVTQFDRPIGYDQYEAAGAFNNRFGRVWTSVGAAGAWLKYDNAQLAGATISQDYRSGFIGRVPVRVGYVIAPLTSVFIEGSGNTREFEVGSFNSNGYRVVGGMLFEPGPGARVKGEAYAGYMEQDYRSGSFVPVSTWTAGGSMAWIVTDQLTVSAEGQRQAKEASQSGGLILSDGVSIVESIATFRADYKLTTNVAVGGGASYIRDEYLGANRNDASWSPLASIKYFVDPHLTLGFDYRYVTFGSDGLGIPSYTRNVYLFSANARF